MATSNNNLVIAGTDFDNIKSNLLTFLRTQNVLKDADYTGSVIQTLLDVLAYNTHYNATLAHLLANEMFIDSAVKRSSVVSISKSLGYNPRSIRSARIEATITITPPTSYTSNTATLSKNLAFKGTGQDGIIYTFYPEDDVIAIKADGTFTFVTTLIEGVRTNNVFTVTADTQSGPFELLNSNVDTSTITCKVQTSATELDVQTFVQDQNIVSLTETTRAFFEATLLLGFAALGYNIYNLVLQLNTVTGDSN